jgi:pimeloyl-ACP methyl ester carboxylesterase
MGGIQIDRDTEISKSESSYQCLQQRRSKQLSIRGYEYCIYEWGAADAPLFFYLHGWADTGASFQFVVDALESGWRIIAPDWRGFGRSAEPSEAYWFPDYLADLHEILNHYSAEAPVLLVGHSMGGNIASLYAGTMPERVAALVNIEGFGLQDSDPQDAPKRYRSWLQAIEARPKFSSYPSYAALASRIQQRNPGLDDAKADFVARLWATTDGSSVRLRADPSHKLPNPVLYRRAEAEACWRNISAKTLLLSGDRSPFAAKVGNIGELPYPDSTTESISGVGHMIHFEAPDRLAQLIEQFLKKTL